MGRSAYRWTGGVPRATSGVRRRAGAVVGPGPGDGAAVAAFVGGRPVVDLWAGAVAERSLVHTLSTIKPLAATCVLLLVGAGPVGARRPGRRGGGPSSAPPARAATWSATCWPTRRGWSAVPAARSPTCSTRGQRGGPGGGRARLAAGPGPRRARPDLREPARRGGAPGRRSLARPLPGRRGGRPARPRPPRRGAAADLARVVDVVGVTPAWWTRDAGRAGLVALGRPRRRASTAPW